VLDKESAFRQRFYHRKTTAAIGAANANVVTLRAV